MHMGQIWMWKKDKFPDKEMIIKRSLSLRTQKGNIRPIHLQQPRWPGLGRETQSFMCTSSSELLIVHLMGTSNRAPGSRGRPVTGRHCGCDVSHGQGEVGPRKSPSSPDQQRRPRRMKGMHRSAQGTAWLAPARHPGGKVLLSGWGLLS